MIPDFDSSAPLTERVLLALAGLFVALGMFQLAWARGAGQEAILSYGLPGVVWFISFAAAHYFVRRRLGNHDPLLLPLAGLLSGWGLIEIARLAPAFLWRQMLWLPVSVGAMLLVTAAPGDLRWLRRFKYTWLFAGLLLVLATVFVGVNPSGYGERLWLGLGGIYFQPSEILKLLLVVYVAAYLAEKRELLVAAGPRLGRWRIPALPYLAPLLAMWALAMGLLAWQRDLGAAVLFFFTFLAMLYLAGGQWGYLVAGSGLFLLGAGAAYRLIDRVAVRVDAWWNPWPDASGRSYQIVQSLLALASGGLVGQGLGQGAPTVIPVVHSDFVFAAIGEEFGLVGTLAALLCIAVLVMRGLRAAMYARMPFEQLLAAGLSVLIGLQAWVIMGGNARLIPLTGVTLPFVSYGGSSLLSNFIALGLLLHIHKPNGQSDPRLTRTVRKLAAAVNVLLGALALTLGYWQVVRAPALVRRDDNPRLVLAEQAIRRGTIFDRNGVPLALTQMEQGRLVRRYPEPQAEPLIGYYSLRYGTAWAEAAFDARLRGVEGKSEQELWWHNLLHRPQVGQSVTLTIDLDWQRAAYAALGNQTGVALAADLHSGYILAMASTPTFDPNRLDADWDELGSDPAAPLVNRAVQGQYQPGSLFQAIVLEQALRAGLVQMTSPVQTQARSIHINGLELGCASPHLVPEANRTLTWQEAYAAGCPAPFVELSDELSLSALQNAIRRWQLDKPLSIGLPGYEAAAFTQTFSESDKKDIVAGQGPLTFTPLGVLRLLMQIANDGRDIAPSVTGASIEQAQATELRSNEMAALRAAWERHCNSMGIRGLAASGSGYLGWYIGTGRQGSSDYGIVVLVENVADGAVAADVACAFVSKAGGAR